MAQSVNYSYVSKSTIDSLIFEKAARLQREHPELDQNECVAKILNDPANIDLYKAYCRTSSVNGTSDD
jgi:hypothetical protein